MKKDSKTKIARVYALALYEAAEERKAVPQVSDDMMKLFDAVRADAWPTRCGDLMTRKRRCARWLPG